MITIMGATGHTGKKITEALLKAGKKVRALGRSENKLAELKRAGAEVLAGDTTDAAFLTKAFRGADAVYTLLPTDPHAPDFRGEQDRQGEAIVKAVRDSSVQYVVALSSIGANLSEGTGVIAGLHAQEERFIGKTTGEETPDEPMPATFTEGVPAVAGTIWMIVGKRAGWPPGFGFG